ncbi:hypothetical protein B0189_05025 [Moraxella cuniculi]|nr:hypothetical protein B0189_05025 [Moraxella cuniculi]
MFVFAWLCKIYYCTKHRHRWRIILIVKPVGLVVNFINQVFLRIADKAAMIGSAKNLAFAEN